MNYISDIRKKVGHDAIFMPTSGCVIIKDNRFFYKKGLIMGNGLFMGVH